MGTEVTHLISLAAELHLLADREQAKAERLAWNPSYVSPLLRSRDALRAGAEALEGLARRTDREGFERAVEALGR